ncbi:MAG: SDR family oxidoreductase [Chloroflexi bacterium]|nr:SDR family oxidoreductase [Chloroflexota bacterium]
MQVDLKDKVVCVTGAARRVGRAIALAFAAEGAHVVIHHSASDIEAEATAKEARSMGVVAFVIKADQSKPDEVAHMFESIRDHYGRLDVLVNSAANFKRTNLLDISYEEWQEVMGVNLTGPFLCTQHAARLMIEGGIGGAIINIGDVAGQQPWKTRPHHSISKAGVMMLTKVSALSLGEHNIRVNCVVPGPVMPPVGSSPELWQSLAEKSPIKRNGDPDDVARACVFLATNDFVTGAILAVDGGEGVNSGR